MLKLIVHGLMLMIHAKTSEAWHALNFAIVEASAGWGPSDRVKELPSLAVKHLEFLEALIHVLPNSSTTLGSWIDHKMYGKNHALLGEGISLLVHCSLHFARLLIFNSMCGLGISLYQLLSRNPETSLWNKSYVTRIFGVAKSNASKCSKHDWTKVVGTR